MQKYWVIMKVRTRFAPSPTGSMHLGNIKTALFNYLFAKQNSGRFILRIEDTDRARNTSEGEQQILEDLKWLELTFDEGPKKGGTHGPYCQSERNEIYNDVFKTLVENHMVYRCFCNGETLKNKREMQMAAKCPPRYDRTCLGLPPEKIKQKVAAGIPFVWRFKINDKQRIEFDDMAKGKMSFDLSHFSDFTLTRPDGTFTFIFTNFVDDWKMEISHVIRGEDHLSNTAMQGALAHALSIKMPTFWHQPMICDVHGKKLSKRSAHFSLKDLKEIGFLPEAICNYLALIGGQLKNEIQSTKNLVQNFNFEHIHASGAPKFDVEKLNWVNHKWITKIDEKDLAERVKPFIDDLMHIKNANDKTLINLVSHVKEEVKTLCDFKELLKFYFVAPTFSFKNLKSIMDSVRAKSLVEIIKQASEANNQFESFLSDYKVKSSANGYKPKEIFSTLRYALTGKLSGIGIHELEEMLGYDEIQSRIRSINV
ncbi:glutamate--tRNA ligase [Candidatus Dependentiae bacterium]